MKLPISALSAAAALLGYAASNPGSLTGGLLAAVSVFLLSGGACALNNYQDRTFDKTMERTRQRPLPSNTLLPRHALIQALLLLSAGMAGLFLYSSSLFAPLGGLLAVVLYNGFYTPLKKRTLFALVPGVLCGMAPPLIGWFAAGGEAFSSRLIYLCVLFGIWQIPHLWLLTLANNRDYAGPERPSFANVLSPVQMKRLVMIWTLAFAFLTLWLKSFQLIESGPLMILLVMNALALPLVFVFSLYKPKGAPGFRLLFLYLNASILGVTVMAVTDLFNLRG